MCLKYGTNGMEILRFLADFAGIQNNFNYVLSSSINLVVKIKWW